MPTSVLLAVLAAAGLLALAPALTRRYDVPERVAVEPAASTARVLSRRRRRRTVPGSRPTNPPRFRRQSLGSASRAGIGTTSNSGGAAPRSRSGTKSGGLRETGSRTRHASFRSIAARSARRRSRPRRRPLPTALHRRRRVFVALVLLNLIELAGVVLVGPGFWIGFSVSFTVLLADLVYLRRRAVRAAQRRRALRRRQAWIAAQQAAVRREHDRRAALRQPSRLPSPRRSSSPRRAASR